MQPWNEAAYLDYCEVIRDTYREAGRLPDEAYPIWPGRATYDYCAGLSWSASCAKHLRECREALGLPVITPPVSVLTPLAVESARLKNEGGWLHWRGLSEFSAVHLCRTGQEDELIRRLDRAQAAGRNGIRVLMMASNLFDLRPSYPGYWAAADRAVVLARERGLYVEACLFADAQIVMPNPDQRRAVTAAFASWCRTHATVLPQLANEPFKNGWDSAIDPQLLALADVFAANYGKPFSIGDPNDVVADAATGFPLRDTLGILSEHSRILVLHGDRSSSSQWARWVDHLKGFQEVYDNPTACYRIHDEPMGAASVSIPGKRDNRAGAHLAAALVCAVMGIGFTLHYISEQDDRVDDILAACDPQRLVPASPDFIFRNAGTSDASVVAFTDGIDKIRTCDNGHEAWAVGYGPTPSTSTVTWADGWTPEIVLATSNVRLWKATR